MQARKFTFHFRWPIRPTSDVSVEMTVPLSGDGPPVLNTQFCSEHGLSEPEVEKAEGEVIRAIAIIE